MFTINFLQTQLANYPTPNYYWVGFSGGLDSTVLLHALTQLPEKISLRVIHINHSWPGDDEQAAHCITAATQLGVACEVITVNAKPQKGLSLEAIARAARYKTFANLMQKEDCLLTAHQQDDQAETLLLQALRGAGIKGLAAMPAYKPLAAGYHLRPLLNFSRAELQVYAEEHQLNWIEDHNNFNLEFNRNFIRHKLMPLLKQRWPSASATLARTAKHCAEAAELLDTLAEKDLKNILNKKNKSLVITKLLKRNTAQQRNVLRYWLQKLNVSMPSESQLEHIQKDILQSREDANPTVCWGDVEIRRYQDELFVVPSRDHQRADAQIITAPWRSRLRKTWDLNQPLELPNIGTLTAKQITGRGIRCDLITDNQVTIAFRQNGERLQPHGRQGSHPLKKLFQEWKIPTWQRDKIPLVFYHDELIAVVGYAISEKFAARENELGWEIFLTKIC